MAAIQLSQPPIGAHHITLVAETGLHIKTGATDVHLSQWSVVNGLSQVPLHLWQT